MYFDSAVAHVGEAFRRLPRAAAALALAALVMLLAAASPQAQENPVLGDVGRVVGDVSVVRGTEQLPAAPGMALHVGDAVVTGPEARVEILCVDGSFITVGPASSVSVASFAPAAGGPGQALFDLIEGILRVTLSGQAPWSSFQVRSATAVASVRSTDWIVDATRVTTGVFVVDGRVAVDSRAGLGGVVLDPGQGTDVAAGAAPTAPKAWGQKRVDDVLSRTRMP